jgi:endonuclease/exonuclease/phosphatase family metal-dependent hydrolase
MGANISSGNFQSYDPGEGIRIFQGVKPDVVMIQEWNWKTGAATEIRDFVDTTFGTSFEYTREAGAQIPNGIISRYPILESGEWKDASVSNRDFVWARIDIPGPIDLWAVCVHLLTTSATNRNNEATQLIGYISGKVPTTDYLVIGGDFNTSTRSEAAIATFSKTVVVTDPYPADGSGNSNTNASRAKPYDWVLVNSLLSPYKTATVIGASSFSTGLVVDTRVYTPISELSPAVATDSAATNMQHMAVVRDFLVPN